MHNNVIHIIGLGVSEKAELSQSAQHALLNAHIVMGSKRQRETINEYIIPAQHEYVVLPKLAELKSLIQAYRDQSIAILASGDPLYYGIGRWLSDQFEAQHLQFHAAVSSIQIACHRLGVAQQDITVLSLHGRPLNSLRRYLKKHQRLLILTDKNSQPQRLAQECIRAGFSDSSITVCENLGYHNECVSRWCVEALAIHNQLFKPLHMSYLEVLGDGGVLPEFPGIPDHHFATGAVPGKGLISKREVRLSILSLLQLAKEDVVWDIGAGCGGVAVELALWQPQANIYAIECHSQRLGYLRENQQRFGVEQNLFIIEGRAPEALAGLPKPNKIFIGGSAGVLKILLEISWQQLPETGVLVVSAVTDNTQQVLYAFAKKRLPQQIESIELSVKRGQIEQGCLSYTAKLPVEIFKFSKVGHK